MCNEYDDDKEMEILVRGIIVKARKQLELGFYIIE
jgi:hypothetical protein